MQKRTWNIYYIISAVGLLSGFFHWYYASGFLVGTIAAAIMYKRDEVFWNRVVDIGVARHGTGLPHFLGNYAVMAILMILAAKFPQFMNIFAVAFGLMTIKFALFLEVLLPGKEKRE